MPLQCAWCEKEVEKGEYEWRNKEIYCKDCLENISFCVSCGEPSEDLNNLGLCEECNEAFNEFVEDTWKEEVEEIYNQWYEDNEKNLLESFCES